MPCVWGYSSGCNRSITWLSLIHIYKEKTAVVSTKKDIKRLNQETTTKEESSTVEIETTTQVPNTTEVETTTKVEETESCTDEK